MGWTGKYLSPASVTKSLCTQSLLFAEVWTSCFTTQTYCRPPTCYHPILPPTYSHPKNSPSFPPSPILIQCPVRWLTLQLSCKGGVVALLLGCFFFVFATVVVWLFIMSVRVCLALLALSCLTAASSPDCKELLNPLKDQSRVGSPQRFSALYVVFVKCYTAGL